MTAELTRRQQRIAHAYGGSIVCLICRCTITGLTDLKNSWREGTSLGKDDLDCRYRTTRKGIEIRDRAHREYRIDCTPDCPKFCSAHVTKTGSPPLDLLTWGALTRHISALPDSLRDNPAHADAHNPPHFEGEPVYGNWDHPRTDATWLAWLLWTEHTKTDAQRILDAAFPLALTDEQPTDLFELAGITA